jgi:hypothetical protein
MVSVALGEILGISGSEFIYMPALHCYIHWSGVRISTFLLGRDMGFDPPEEAKRRKDRFDGMVEGVKYYRDFFLWLSDTVSSQEEMPKYVKGWSQGAPIASVALTYKVPDDLESPRRQRKLGIPGCVLMTMKSR